MQGLSMQTQLLWGHVCNGLFILRKHYCYRSPQTSDSYSLSAILWSLSLGILISIQCRLLSLFLGSRQNIKESKSLLLRMPHTWAIGHAEIKLTSSLMTGFHHAGWCSEGCWENKTAYITFFIMLEIWSHSWRLL